MKNAKPITDETRKKIVEMCYDCRGPRTLAGIAKANGVHPEMVKTVFREYLAQKRIEKHQR